MKTLFHWIVLVILCMVVSNVESNATSNVTAANTSEVTLRVTVYNIKKKNFIDIATQEALKRVLFRGVEGTKFNRPLVGFNEYQLLNEHRSYFENLFTNRAQSFVNSFVPQVSGVKDATGKKAWVADVTVNVKALREDLETHKIIRKFGL